MGGWLRNRRIFQRLPGRGIDGHIRIDLGWRDHRFGIRNGFRILLNAGIDLGRRQRRHQARLLKWFALTARS